MEKEKSYPDYIGKKIKGIEKSAYIGQIGEIIRQTKFWVSVKFESGDYWFYPIEFVEQYLVEEEIQLPKRGEEILVWDCEEDEPEKRIYVAYIEGIENPVITVCLGYEKKFRKGEPFCYWSWKYWKPIPKVKEYTHKELEEKLGEKFIYKKD